MSGYRKYAVLLAMLFLAFVLVEYYRPKPINWNPTYSNKDKIPYGTYVLYQLLPDLFPGQRVQPVREPAANHLEELPATGRSSYLFIQEDLKLDSLDLAALLGYVAAGNQVFISATGFPELLQDTLHFRAVSTMTLAKGEKAFTFRAPALQQPRPFRYAAQFAHTYLQADSLQPLQVLGTDRAGKVNFARRPFGAGSFYLHTTPIAFTNYHVISAYQSRYAAIALSHLPVAPVFWDEYQKQGRVASDSKFRVLMAHEPLQWAYYVALAGLVLFVVFEGKRTQRIIPVLEKPRNTTLEFVRVVGNLYFNYRNHTVIAHKKITYFLEYLRLHFYEHARELDQEFRQRLVAKTGLEARQVEDLVNLVVALQAAENVTEQQLIQLNQQLEAFYRLAGRYNY